MERNKVAYNSDRIRDAETEIHSNKGVGNEFTIDRLENLRADIIVKIDDLEYQMELLSENNGSTRDNDVSNNICALMQMRDYNVERLLDIESKLEEFGVF